MGIAQSGLKTKKGERVVGWHGGRYDETVEEE